MIYRIDKNVKMHMKFMLQAYGRYAILEESLNRKSLKLLYEEVDPDDVGEGVSNISDTVQQFVAIFKEYPSAKKMIDEVLVFIKDMPQTAEIKNSFSDENDEDMKRVSKEISTKTDNVVRAMDSVRMGIVKVTDGLKDVVGNDPAMMNAPIASLFDDPEFKDKIKIPKEKFEAGVAKAFQPSEEYESAFQKGMKAAQQSTQGDGKTKLGALFSTIAKFFAGMSSSKSGTDSFPGVYQGFLEFLKGINFQQLQKVSTRMTAEGSTLIIKAANEAGETGGSAAAAAGGANVEKTDDEGGAGQATPPDEVDANLRTSLRQAANNAKTPVDAVIKGIDDWKNSLSKTSQEALTSGGKFDKLKDGIKDAVEKKPDAVKDAVADAVKDWVSKNEETLLKGKKFAKKNFDSLNNLIPQLAAHVEEKKNESGIVLTRQHITKFVHSYLDKRFLNPQSSLNEIKQFDRWKQLAGVK